MPAEVSSLPYYPQQVIGEAFDLEPDALFNKEGHGVVQLNGPLLHMQIYRQEGANVLLLMADLGTLATDIRAEYHQLMLIANSGWRDLAGGALCTNDTGAQALLRLRLDLDTLAAETLVQWVEAFVVAAEAWAERIAVSNSSTGVPDASDAMPRPTTLPQDFPGFLPFNLA